MQQAAASRSNESKMSAGDAESWARLRLVQGESSAGQWELVGSLGHTTLTVGSSADCTWVVREEGVRPIHFSLHWDGGTLRIADLYNAGDVRVDGAALGSQWRPLLGRMRIEFGKAAMVVESSAGARSDSSEHPLDLAASAAPSSRAPASGTLSEIKGEVIEATGKLVSAPSAAPRAGKETLLGVAPLPQEVLALLEAQTGSTSAPAPRDASAAPASAAERSTSLKATLVGGMGVDLAAVPAVAIEAGKANPKANATLMGFNVVNVMEILQGTLGAQAPVPLGEPKPTPLPAAPRPRAEERPSSSSSRPEARAPTSPVDHGAPAASASSAAPARGPASEHAKPSSASQGGFSRRATREGAPIPPPGGPIGAVSQLPFRRVSSSAAASAAPSQRAGSAWQEGAGAFGSRTLRGATQPEPDDEEPPRSQSAGRHSYWEMGDRFSDVPTQMRDPASLEARRPRRVVPWRYVGVLVLTTVAYFAWLYLLDHI